MKQQIHMAPVVVQNPDTPMMTLLRGPQELPGVKGKVQGVPPSPACKRNMLGYWLLGGSRGLNQDTS